MYKGKISKGNENKKHKIVFMIYGVIFIIISFFIDIVFIEVLGFVLLIALSHSGGKKGAVIASIATTIGVLINSFINYGELRFFSITIYLFIYYFIGIIIGKRVDAIKEQKNVLKESNKELLDSERKIRKILETTQDGFCIVGENQRFIDANNAFCKMLGYTKEEILNLTVSDIDFYESSEDVKKRLDRIKKMYMIFLKQNI